MSQRLFALAILCLSLNAMSSPQAHAKAQAEAGISIIHNFYQDAVKRLSFSPYKFQDIEMACMGEIYLQWFGVYSDVIRRTDGLTFGEIQGYREAEQKAHLVENDYQIYEAMRPELISRILDEMYTRRQAAKWPQGPDEVTLPEVQQNLLLGNLNECRNSEFVAAIDKGFQLSEGDYSEDVTRVYARYEPQVKPGEQLGHVPPMYFDIDHEEGDTVTYSYEQWLIEIWGR